MLTNTRKFNNHNVVSDEFFSSLEDLEKMNSYLNRTNVDLKKKIARLQKRIRLGNFFTKQRTLKY